MPKSHGLAQLLFNLIITYYMGLVARKPVFVVFELLSPYEFTPLADSVCFCSFGEFLGHECIMVVGLFPSPSSVGGGDILCCCWTHAPQITCVVLMGHHLPLIVSPCTSGSPRSLFLCGPVAFLFPFGLVPWMV